VLKSACKCSYVLDIIVGTGADPGVRSLTQCHSRLSHGGEVGAAAFR